MKTSTTLVLGLLSMTACGRTEMEWEQKVREVEALSNRVAKQNLERTRLDEDLAKLQEENTALKAELSTHNTSARPAELACAEQTRGDKLASEQLKARADALRLRLESLASDGLTVSLRKGQLTITLPSSLLFEGKTPDPSPGGRKTLRTLAEAILADERLLSRFYLVTAHEVPGKNEEGAIGRSLARAQSVRTLLTGREGGLPPARWSAAGRGVVDPVIGDDQPAQMPKNQRIEIIALPEPGELLTNPARGQLAAATAGPPARRPERRAARALAKIRVISGCLVSRLVSH